MKTSDRRMAETILGWIPIRSQEISPLLATNFKIAGALIDANVLVRAGWRNSTGIYSSGRQAGSEDVENTREELFEDSCWLRYESKDQVYAMAVCGTIGSDVAYPDGGYPFAKGANLYAMRTDLALRRLVLVRWIWSWRIVPATGELMEQKGGKVVDLPGIDESIVRAPLGIKEDFSFQTRSYSLQFKLDDPIEVRLAVFTAIARNLARKGHRHNASLHRLLAPFSKAFYGYDPQGLEFVSSFRSWELFLSLARMADECGFSEACEALIGFAYQGFASRDEIPWRDDWRFVWEFSSKVGNCDLALFALNECLRLGDPSNGGNGRDKRAITRADVRQCCLDWLRNCRFGLSPQGLDTFLELTDNAKRLPRDPSCDELGDQEFDSLALAGRQIREQSAGYAFGEVFRAIAKRVANPNPDVRGRLLDMELFKTFTGRSVSDMLDAFPNPVPSRGNRREAVIIECRPERGMSHEELWNWLGCKGDGQPVLPKETADAYAASRNWGKPYDGNGRAMRQPIFGIANGTVEILGVDNHLPQLGSIAIKMTHPSAGVSFQLFPQIPLASFKDFKCYTEPLCWHPWFDETCAYGSFGFVTGGQITAVYPLFAGERFWIEPDCLYKTFLSIFADRIDKPSGNDVVTHFTPCAPGRFNDSGVVVGQTSIFEMDGLGLLGAMTIIAFDNIPVATPVFHRHTLNFVPDDRVTVSGWAMIDALSDSPKKGLYSILR